MEKLKHLFFNIGDESRPKIEDLNNRETYENSFASDVYKKAFSLINSVLENFRNEKIKSEYPNVRRERNNIIAFIGGRGTGKTSCMQSVYQTLGKPLGKHLADNWPEIANSEFLLLPVIDPTYFEERNNILEMIIARMFQVFRQFISTPKNSYGRDDVAMNIEQRNALIKAFQKVKDSLDAINGRQNASNDSIEELADLAGGINLHENMMELVKNYLSCFNRNTLAIAIDDIDLQTKYADKMVEQIRRYFITPNVVILIGVKMNQLTDLIKQTYYREYKDLIGQQQLTDTVENMAGRYLAKLIPYNHRITLPDIETQYYHKLILCKDGEIQNNFESINLGVLQLIYSKTRYMFYDSDIKCSKIIPRNLRDLLNVVAMLYSMEDLYDEKKLDKSNCSEIIQKNRTIFKNYFIQNWCCDNLSADMFMFIRELGYLEPSSVNKQIVDFITKKRPTGNGHWDSTIIYEMNRSYNVSLSDMYYVLDKISNSSIPYIQQFVFAVKTVYSMMLCDYAENLNENLEERSQILYERLTNLKTAVNNSKSLKKNSKLMIYSNYEKLLGGNLLRVAGFYKTDNNNEGNTMISTNSYTHLRKIDGGKLGELFECVCTDEKWENGASPYPNISRPQALKILEFFLLSIYIPSSRDGYRGDRRCYYDSLLLEDKFDKTLIYSSTSTLFNIVKMYNYYNLYSRLKNKDGLNKQLFFRFFKIIERYKNDSLIHQMVMSKNNKKQFSDAYIRNIEVLESLQDYLPYLRLQYSNSKEILEQIVLFYDKLSTFDYYLYAKKRLGDKSKKNSYSIKKFAVFTEIANFLNQLKTDTSKEQTGSECINLILYGIFRLKKD